MSDAGSTRFPESPRIPASMQQGYAKDNSRGILLIKTLRDENGQIIRNTGDKPVRIEGEIEKTAENGKIRIKTDKGMVDIEVSHQGENSKTPPLRPGMKIEIDLPPERQRNTQSPEIQAQIRVRESGPKPAPETSAPERSPSVNIPYAPRPEVYTPPAKAPENIPPQDIARNLIGVTVRMDPVPPDQLQSLQTQILNASPPVILPTKLTAQIEALAQTLPLQIAAEQTAAMALMPLTTPQTTIETPRLENVIFQIYQVNKDTLSSKILAPEQQFSPSTLLASSKPNEIISIFKQPFDIKSNFLFLSPDTIKISATSTTQGSTLPPQSPNMPMQTPPSAALSGSPITAVFKGIELPPVLFQPISDDTGQPLSLSPIKADSFAKPDSILVQTGIGQLTLTVQGATPQNLPVVTLSAIGEDLPFTQSFILQAPLGAFPPQSTIELSSLTAVSQNAQGVQNMLTAQSFLPLMPLIPQGWPVLSDIVQTLQAGAAANPAANPAGAMLPSPQAPSQMGPMALFVIAALRNGDLGQILSERAQHILKTAGKSALVSSLSQDGQAISRTESPSQDWRVLTLPMLWENEVNKVILHYKNDGGGDEHGGGEKGKQTRFIFDLNLSRMGKVQLDGLFRDKRMDMVLRTQEPFSRAMQIHIQSGYSNALELTGLIGDISFQNDPQSWVRISSADNTQFKTNI